ncbi:MAG: DUF4443 domain-containing protein [Sulfolobaceae archaeon]
MDYLKLLEILAAPKQGNKPNFEKQHVLLLLDLLSTEQPLGRISIMKRLNLTEATVKTLLKRLRKEQIIEVDRIGGARLSEKGIELLNYIKSNFKIVEKDLKSIKWEGNLILLKKKSYILNNIGLINLRDQIIKFGADKVLIARVMENGEVEIPPFKKEEIMDLLLELEGICRELHCENTDLIIYLVPANKLIAYKVALEILKL